MHDAAAHHHHHHHAGPRLGSSRFLLLLGAAAFALVVVWLTLLHSAFTSILSSADAIDGNDASSTTNRARGLSEPLAQRSVPTAARTTAAPDEPCTQETIRSLRRRVAQLEAILAEGGRDADADAAAAAAPAIETDADKGRATRGRASDGVCAELRGELGRAIQGQRKSQHELQKCGVEVARLRAASTGGTVPRAQQQKLAAPEHDDRPLATAPVVTTLESSAAPLPLPQQQRGNDGFPAEASGGSVIKGPTDPAGDGPGTIPILLLAYSRPALLRKLIERLGELAAHPGLPPFRLVVSHDADGLHPDVAAVIQEAQQSQTNSRALGVVYLSHVRDDSGATPEEEQNGWRAYYAISHHYAWALARTFDLNRHYSRVILLEEDLEIADDFLEFMVGAAPLLDADESLLCVSGFNDNGKPALVQDPGAVYRSDFFPGLGWMMTRRIWDSELRAKWPRGFWDDWLRQPEQRRGRSCLRPEVSRSKPTCEDGEGASQGQFCGDHLKQIVLYASRGSGGASVLDQQQAAQRWSAQALSEKLLPAAYDAQLRLWLSQAKVVYSPGAIDALPPSVAEVKMSYGSNDEFQVIAHAFGIMDDFKDGVPRTAYHGVVTFRWRGAAAGFAPSPRPRMLNDGGRPVVRVHLFSERILYNNSAS